MAQIVNDGNKGRKPKKAGKPKKKGGSAKPKKRAKKESFGLFSKIMIIVFIVLLAIVLVLSNIKKTNKQKDERTTEVKIEKDEVKVEKEEAIAKKDEVKEKKDDPKEGSKPIEKSVVVKSIEGSWLSMMKGAVLTMKDFEYRIDFSGVDASNPIIGKFEVDGNKVIFRNSQDPCKDVEGVYKVEIDRGNISFTCKKDGCTKRKNTLAADWEWFEN